LYRSDHFDDFIELPYRYGTGNCVTLHLFSSGCIVERPPHCEAGLGPGSGRNIPSRRPHQTGGNLGSARQKGSVSDPDPHGLAL
jgi:hypothetical protein